jgi:hypothetical protein
MSDVSIEVVGDWLGTTGDPEEATFASLVVLAGGVPLTEVHDALSRSIRPSIRVPAVRVARWLLTEWWRLRWEARPEVVTPEWRMAHSMAGIGGGYAWPDLEISSDGETVQLSIEGERSPDAAAIRFLQRARIEVPAAAWESAVDRFVDTVETRLGDVLPEAQEIAELRAELRAERDDSGLALRCRREARAGYEPGDASADWHLSVERLAAESGPISAEEVLAVTHDGVPGLSALHQLRAATTEIDLAAASRVTVEASGKPWERASSAARRARDLLGVGEGPLGDDKLAEVLGRRLPVEGTASADVEIAGGFRPRDGGGSARVLLGTERPTSQRFALARLFGMAALLPRAEQGLVLTSVKSAAQKFSRAFAQELLCPWAELDAFTDEHGVGERAIARAASRYQISEMAITASLVNHGKLERDRLATFTS